MPQVGYQLPRKPPNTEESQLVLSSALFWCHFSAGALGSGLVQQALGSGLDQQALGSGLVQQALETAVQLTDAAYDRTTER